MTITTRLTIALYWITKPLALLWIATFGKSRPQDVADLQKLMANIEGRVIK